MTREEKLQLIRDRQKAVRDAWSREKTLVCQGKGTVNWNSEQQRELMEKGRVSGYEGQHMKSVSQYPEYASSADNIQFLTHEDHLAAHNMGNVNEQNGYHSVTNGYYDPETHEIENNSKEDALWTRIIMLVGVRWTESHLNRRMTIRVRRMKRVRRVRNLSILLSALKDVDM